MRSLDYMDIFSDAPFNSYGDWLYNLENLYIDHQYCYTEFDDAWYINEIIIGYV